MNEYLERYGRGGRQVSMLETEKYIYSEGGGSLTRHVLMRTARYYMQSHHTVGSLCIFRKLQVRYNGQLRMLRHQTQLSPAGRTST